MSLLHTIYNTILEALFPLTSAEREVLSYSPEDAFKKLPPAPTLPTFSPPIEASSIFAYKDERVAKLIWNVKYKKSAEAVKTAGYALYQTLQGSALLSSKIILIPMPITARRRRERGFNQCELLVDEIARLDKEGRLSVTKDLLIRTQHTTRQTLKGREERLEDAKGIFEVLQGLPSSTNATLIVIDDVITTGSTIKEAIETLKKAGFENVRGLSVAH